MKRILIKKRHLSDSLTVQRKFLGFWIPVYGSVTTTCTGLNRDLSDYLDEAKNFYGDIPVVFK